MAIVTSDTNETQNSANTQKQNTKQAEQNQYVRKKQHKNVLGQNP